MNPTQQRQHKTAIQTLEADTEQLIRGATQHFAQSIREERIDRQKAVNELRVEVEKGDASVRSSLKDFQAMSLYRRVRWLLTGQM